MSDKKSQNTKDTKPKSNKERQEKVIENVKENLSSTGEKKLEPAMKKAGYSDSYARASTQMKDTRTFREKFDELMPEEEIMGWHNNLGNAKKTQQMMVGKDVSDEDIEAWVSGINCVLYKIVEGSSMKTVLYWARDNKAIKDAIDMAYKIRGDYSAEKTEDVTANPFMKMTDAELAQSIKEAEAFLTKESPTVPKSADTTEKLEDGTDPEEINKPGAK